MSFIKKELIQIIKTSKKITLPAIMFIFAVISPLTAKYISELISLIDSSINIDLPEPTYIDAFVQFYKNINQTVIIILIFLMAGSIVEEKTKGTVYLVLTKPVTRTNFIISKYLGNFIYFTISYLIGVIGFVYYLNILFPNYNFSNIGWALVLPWIFGIVMISFTLFFSTVSKSYTISVLGSFITYILMSIFSALPKIGKYSPAYLTNYSFDIFNDIINYESLFINLGISIMLIIVSLALSIISFNKQEL